MVMRALDRKLFRDLARMRVQAIAIALVVASGVALFLGTVATYRAMKASEQLYYVEYRFAHAWAAVTRAPSTVTRAIAAIPGVSAVEGRIKQPVLLDVPGLEQPASGEMVSIPRTPRKAVNALHVRRGRYVEPGRAGEVLVSEAFADANRLELGNTMIATVAGQRVLLRIVGVALSPEYVMPMTPSGLAPDDRRFGILWMAQDELEALTDLRGAVNEVAMTLAPGADERALIAEVDRIVAPYGGRGAYGRASQASHNMLEDHIKPLRSLAILLPTIFLLVSAFLVNVVLSRIVATQREQIGLLKAFGYTSGRIALHYLELTLLILLPGVALGLPSGAWLGGLFSDFYARFFRFPVLVFRIEPAVALAASLIAIGAASLGALGSVRRVIALQPIVAMSAEIPSFRGSLLDRLGITAIVSEASRMIVRNVIRHPLRTVLGVTGMALAVAVLMLGTSVGDSMERVREVRFQAEQREDVSISLAHPRALGTACDFLALPGAIRVEPFRVVPARLIGVGRTRDLLIYGLPDGGLLRYPTDSAYRRSKIPRDGALMTASVAAHFGVRKGDEVALEIRENRRRVVTAQIVDLVDEPLGAAVYMDLEEVGRLLGEPATYSGANLTVDPAREREFFAVLKRTPAAIAVDLRTGALKAYRAMSDGAVEFIRIIDIVFAVIIAFGVVYNTAKIALAERARELATLRVLGFTRAEVSRILLGEIAVLAGLAIPIGLAVGAWLSRVVIAVASSDRLHLPKVVGPSTYAFTVVVFVVAALASALVVRRGLDRLDLVAVLKARE